MQYVTTTIKDRIGYIYLNRPEKRNALNQLLVNELKSAIQSMNSDQYVRCIILGSSGNVFCAGADLAYIQDLQNYTYEQNLEDSRNLAGLFQDIYTLSKPIISVVKGAALAGGCGLATICDICFATPSATFGYTEAKIGFIPALVMLFLRKKVSESISKRILLSAEVFDATKALQYGLVTEIVEEENMDTYVHDWAMNLIANSSPISMGLIKQMYATIDGLSLEESIEFACEMNAKSRATEDCKAGINAFLNKQKPIW